MSEGTILIVSKELSIARALRITLAAKGYEVTHKESVDGAVRAGNSEKYDLVLLDNDTTSATIADACREIRGCSGMAVIIMSGDDSQGKKARAIFSGADAYLPKPFGVAEVFASIRANMHVADSRCQKPAVAF